MKMSKNNENFIVKKGTMFSNSPLQSISVRKDIIVKLRKKYPDINITKTTEKLLESLLK